MSLAVVVAGLVAGLSSIPHCAAMCGPLAVFACARRPARSVLPRWQGGRMIGYALVGAVAGGAGGLVAGAAAARWAPALVSWSCAVALAIAAVRSWPRRSPLVRLRTGAAASTAAAGPPRRSLVARVMARSARSPALFGAATALLPCGALAAAVLLAASSARPTAGALTMIAFAIGSAPGLIGVGWLGAALGRTRRSLWSARLVAVTLALGALLFAYRPVPALLGGPPACHCHATTEVH